MARAAWGTSCNMRSAWYVLRIDQHRNTKCLRHRCVQKLQALSRNLSDGHIVAGGISARPSEVGDKAQSDRVVSDAEYNGDRCGRSFGRLGSVVATGCGDNDHPTADNVSHDRRQAVKSFIQPVVLHNDVLALGVASFVETF